MSKKLKKQRLLDKYGINNFRIKIQVADYGDTRPGGVVQSNWLSDQAYWSDYAFDLNKRDPDAIRIKLEISNKKVIIPRDFRIGIKFIDKGGASRPGIAQYTKWASEGGGGWSGFATDTNAYDPDGVAVVLQTRPWPNWDKGEKVISDLRIGLQVFDKGGSSAGEPVYTPSLKQGGGWTQWGFDRNGRDPDGAKIKLQVNKLILKEDFTDVF